MNDQQAVALLLRNLDGTGFMEQAAAVLSSQWLKDQLEKAREAGRAEITVATEKVIYWEQEMHFNEYGSLNLGSDGGQCVQIEEIRKATKPKATDLFTPDPNMTERYNPEKEG